MWMIENGYLLLALPRSVLPFLSMLCSFILFGTGVVVHLRETKGGRSLIVVAASLHYEAEKDDHYTGYTSISFTHCSFDAFY